MKQIVLFLFVYAFVAANAQYKRSPSYVKRASDSQGLSPACAALSLYPVGFTLNESKSIDPIVPLAKPARGVAYKEPAYGTCMVRATDHTVDGTSTYARNNYSRRQAFNCDSTLYIIEASDGGWHLYDAKTRQHIKKFEAPGFGGGDISEPQWSPTDPDKLVYMPVYGMQLMEFTVSTQNATLLVDFGPRLKAIWPAANTAWTRGEGSPSKDARYWCFMVDSEQWVGLGFFIWDRQTDTITGTHTITPDKRPDHVSMTPSGNYCESSGGDGTIAWSRDFSSSKQLFKGGEHSDYAVGVDGDDYFVSIDYSAEGDGWMFMVNVRTGVRTNLLPTYIAHGATALHISGKAFNVPGWVVLSTYADDGPNGRQWLYKKVMAVQLAANPKVYNLAFTREVYGEYFTEPQASVNRDFTRILFNSNWDKSSDTGDIDAYMIELPVGAIGPSVSSSSTAASTTSTPSASSASATSASPATSSVAATSASSASSASATSASPATSASSATSATKSSTSGSATSSSPTTQSSASVSSTTASEDDLKTSPAVQVAHSFIFVAIALFLITM